MAKRLVPALPALLLLGMSAAVHAQEGGDSETGKRIEACAKLLPASEPKYAVDFRLEMNPNATVKSVTPLDAKRANSPNLKSATDCVRRAFLDGGPLKLPPEKYNDWKVLTVTIQMAPKS
jgi:hypothetical protein